MRLFLPSSALHTRNLLPFFILGILILPGTVSASSVPSITVSAGAYSETVPSETVSSWLHISTKSQFAHDYRSEVENPAFCPVGYRFCDFAMPREKRAQVRTVLLSSVSEEKIQKFLDDFAAKADVDPQDAVFAGDSEGKIIVATPEAPGATVNKEESLAILKTALMGEQSGKAFSLRLPVETVAPAITARDKERLGLREMIGEGKTNFAGSPKNRIYNINRSIQQFQGVMIAPGEEFSFVEHLGEVDGEHGYLQELVIRNNKTEPEFGGGICQVSTTVFRAAIWSGMKITERRNHSYPVQYYKPYGMDATVYVPRPDFKFMNNTGHSVFMQASIQGTELYFRFFGTKDGRTVSVDGPHILQSNPDGSMKTVFTQMVSRDGKEFIKDSFWSNYKSPALFPHPGEEQKLSDKPKNWSNKQWAEYKRLNP